MKKSIILIYRDKILPRSQTFVKNQGDNLTQFLPKYIGSKYLKSNSLPIKEADRVTLNGGSVYGHILEFLFKIFHYSTPFYHKLSGSEKLIHAHIGPDGVWARRLSKKLGIPLVLTFHGKDSSINWRTFNKLSVRHYYYLLGKKKLIKDVDLFIAVSKYVKQMLISEGFPIDKIVQHYIGVDINKFQTKVIEKKPIVLGVGRMVEKKGFEYLIKAMSIAKEKFPEYELVLIGDGPLRKQLEELCRKNLDNFIFTGFLKHDEIVDWMDNASIFAAPSVTAENGDIEGLPTVLVEAAAMSLPVVATYHSGIPELVTDNMTGFLSDEKDIKQLSNHLIDLMGNTNLRQKFGEQGRKVVLDNFDIKIQTKKLEKIYSNVINNY